jgi:translation initiation factor 1
MAKKNNPDKNGYVYSTNSDFQFENENDEAKDTLSASQQKLKIRLDNKRRGGKTVTLVEGFIGKDDDLQTLGKSLKNYCGTGGSAKDGEIIIQGDQREKVYQWLIKNDYKSVKKL